MSLDDDILIDNYLRDLLDDKQKVDFEERLQTDSEFLKNFELEQALWQSQNDNEWSFTVKKTEEYKDYKSLLEGEDLQNLKENLKQINSDFKFQSNKKSRSRFYYIVAAASIVILIALNLFLKQDVSNQELVENYLNTNDLPSFVNRGDSTENLIKAQQLFENENYQQALDLFVASIDTANDNPSVYLYTGVSQMKLKDYISAESTFDKLIQSDLLDAEKGYWYKALLYLEQDRVADAKAILNGIISKRLYNYKKAEVLLSELNND